MTRPLLPSQPLRTVWLCVLALCAGGLLVVWPQGLIFEGREEEALLSFSEALSWWKTAGVLFLGGLLTALTPCVYPLIPITVGVLGASNARSKAHALALTSAYIVGMGLVFSLAGIAAALSGRAFGFLLSSRWVLLGLSGFVAVLAASMLGAFELRLPHAWAQRLGRLGRGGRVFGALFMGGAAGLLAAPCTGPVLSGLLAYIAQRQAFWLGTLGLFIYAMGIGLPFFLVGVFALKLPKGRGWMQGVKVFFGVVLGVLALRYLQEGWPFFDAMVVWGAHNLGGRPLGLLVVGALMFFSVMGWGLLERLKQKAPSHFRRDTSKILILAMVFAAILLRFELPPAKATHAPFEWTHQFSSKSHFAADFDEVLSQAKAQKQPVMVDFFAQWCAACKELEKISYKDAKVLKEATRFVRIKIDGTRESQHIEALYERFSVRGLPTVLFINPQGQLLSTPRVEGFVGPRELLRRMQEVY